MANIAFEEKLDRTTTPSHTFPVLQSSVNEVHAQQTLDMDQIPSMPISFPSPSLELASVWTYVAYHCLHEARIY